VVFKVLIFCYHDSIFLFPQSFRALDLIAFDSIFGDFLIAFNRQSFDVNPLTPSAI
jgi:hypothetical protein